MAAEVTGSNFVGEILSRNKELLIALGIIMFIVFLLKWFQIINEKLERLN